MFDLLPGAILALQCPDEAGDASIGAPARFEQPMNNMRGINERPLPNLQVVRG